MALLRATTAYTLKQDPSPFADTEEVLDYPKGIDVLSPSNVLSFLHADGSLVTVRPSGTEPKLKLYVAVTGENAVCASLRHEALCSAFEARLPK